MSDLLSVPEFAVAACVRNSVTDPAPPRQNFLRLGAVFITGRLGPPLWAAALRSWTIRSIWARRRASAASLSSDSEVSGWGLGADMADDSAVLSV